MYFRTDEVLALIILPLLVPFAHTQVKRKRKGSATNEKYFQPSKIEQKQGFLLHVQVIANLLYTWFTKILIISCFFFVGRIQS